MITASFGGLLKDFRSRKGMTQNDVAYAMGWSEPSRLSRIEQGKTVKPTRETVDRLMGVLRLDRNERGQLLLAGGYLPTMEEIAEIRREVKPLLDKWPYPAYLLDFAWRLIEWNKQAAEIYELLPDIEAGLHKNPPNSLEFLFMDGFIQNRYLKDEVELQHWHNLILEKLVRFRLANASNTSEKWYQDFMGKMMKVKLFTRMWQQAQQECQERGIANYEHKLLVDVKDTSKRLDLHIMRSALLQDVRFQMNYHIPGNEETMKRFGK